jgi:hypothetical protein
MSPAPRLLERLTRVTPFGIRFWDDATGAVVADGLRVEVYPTGEPERRTAAVANRVGTFVAARLGGPRDPRFEFGAGDDAFWSAVRARPYTVEVTDRSGRFVPFLVEHPLPTRGHVVPLCLPQSPPETPVLPLYSMTSRPVPSGMAVIRAELRHQVSVSATRTGFEPAAWAVLEARVAGQPPAYGIADRGGRAAIVLPYPEPVTSPARPASPPDSNQRALVNQKWKVSLDVFFHPEAPIPDLPDLCRTLAQPRGALWEDVAGGRPLGERTLQFGRELIVRSELAVEPSMLIVTPAGSPP